MKAADPIRHYDRQITNAITRRYSLQRRAQRLGLDVRAEIAAVDREVAKLSRLRAAAIVARTLEIGGLS